MVNIGTINPKFLKSNELVLCALSVSTIDISLLMAHWRAETCIWM